MFSCRDEDGDVGGRTGRRTLVRPVGRSGGPGSSTSSSLRCDLAGCDFSESTLAARAASSTAGASAIELAAGAAWRTVTLRRLPARRREPAARRSSRRCASTGRCAPEPTSSARGSKTWRSRAAISRAPTSRRRSARTSTCAARGSTGCAASARSPARRSASTSSSGSRPVAWPRAAPRARRRERVGDGRVGGGAGIRMTGFWPGRYNLRTADGPKSSRTVAPGCHTQNVVLTARAQGRPPWPDRDCSSTA